MLARPLTDDETRAVFERVLKDCVAGKPASIPVGAGLDAKTMDALADIQAGRGSESAARAVLEGQLDGSHAREAAAEYRALWDSL
jgi:hypothetical protein